VGTGEALILFRAWDEVRRNRGAPGADGVTIGAVEASGVAGFLEQLAAQLRAGTYRPRPLRRVLIPKPGQPGRTRPLGIPCGRDRVVMTAAKLVLAPVFEADFLPQSYGFRPRRSARQAREVIRVEANRGVDWVLDADVRDGFGSIRHDALLALVAKRVSDRAMLRLLRAWLRVGCWRMGDDRDRRGHPARLTDLPLAVQRRAPRVGCGMDADQQQARGAGGLRRRLRRALPKPGSRRGGAAAGDGDPWPVGVAVASRQDQYRAPYPGRAGRRLPRLPLSQGGVVALARALLPAPMAIGPGVRQVRAKVREATSRRETGRAVEWVVADLNHVLRGWGASFRYGNSARKFAQIDNYVHERLAIFASIKHGRHGRNWQRHYTWAWASRLGTYRLSRDNAEWDCARLAVNDVGKPGAGEPHARFDRGRWRSSSHGEPEPMHPPGNRRD
jgi:RNA-directed DNA polymerase